MITKFTKMKQTEPVANLALNLLVDGGCNSLTQQIFTTALSKNQQETHLINMNNEHTGKKRQNLTMLAQPTTGP